MSGTYIRLNPADLGQIFQPKQRLTLVLNRSAGEEGPSEHLCFEAYLSKFESDQIVLTMPTNILTDWKLFYRGRVVTIETGRSNGLFIFKSKIISKNSINNMIYIESPKILAGKERRGSPRVPLTVPVIYRVVSFKNRKLNHLADKIGTGESQDLAKGGITLLTDLLLPVGLTLIVEFTLEGQNVSLAGIVRRAMPMDKTSYQYAIGINFLQPGPKHQELIQRAMERSSERFKGKIAL